MPCAVNLSNASFIDLPMSPVTFSVSKESEDWPVIFVTILSKVLIFSPSALLILIVVLYPLLSAKSLSSSSTSAFITRYLAAKLSKLIPLAPVDWFSLSSKAAIVNERVFVSTFICISTSLKFL